MPEAKNDSLSVVRLENNIGLQARLQGSSAFEKITDRFIGLIQHNPEAVDTLQTLVDASRVSKRDFAQELTFGSGDKPRTLSDRLVGRWTVLAAEKALLEAKGPLNESEGQRYLAVDGDVARLEDALLLAHSGKKDVFLDKDAVNVLTDLSGDRLDNVTNALQDVAASLRMVKGKTATKLVTALTLGELVVQVACARPTPTISPDVTPPAITQTVPGMETPSPTEFKPTLTPAPYTTEAAPGVQYGPPSLSDAAFHEGSGGSARGVVLEQTRMDEADLVAYENAARDGAIRSGFSLDQLELVYLYDEAHGQWNMVLKLTDGRYLWSQKISDSTYSTFPLQITISEGGEAVWNTDYALIPVPDSAGAEPFYTSGGYVELKGGTHVAIGADTYYSQWFNTLTGQWEAVTEVQAALRASLPDVTFGLAATAEEVPDLGSMDKLIDVAKYFAAQPRVIANDQIAQMTAVEQPDVSEVFIFCNPGGLKNCAILATTRVGEKYYLIVQFGTSTGPKNLLLYLGSPMVGHDESSARGKLERLNRSNSFTLEIVTRIKTTTYDNPEIYKLTVGSDDALPEGSQLLGEGEITDQQEITPMWAIVP